MREAQIFLSFEYVAAFFYFFLQNEKKEVDKVIYQTKNKDHRASKIVKSIIVHCITMYLACMFIITWHVDCLCRKDVHKQSAYSPSMASLTVQQEMYLIYIVYTAS